MFGISATATAIGPWRISRMKRITGLALGLFVCMAVHAKLVETPSIESVWISSTNSRLVWIRLKGLPTSSGFSTNGGASFEASGRRAPPPGYTTNLNAADVHYVLAEAETLVRTEDGGSTWHRTQASRFLRSQTRLMEQRDTASFWVSYGSRLPERQEAWYLALELFGILHAGLVLYVLTPSGISNALQVAARSTIILHMAAGFLWFTHTVYSHITHSQFPEVLWNTSGYFSPSKQLGVAMHIAAQPLPLLGYLLTLWPLLPGTSAILAGRNPSVHRRRLSLNTCAFLGTVFVAFHLWLVYAVWFEGFFSSSE